MTITASATVPNTQPLSRATTVDISAVRAVPAHRSFRDLCAPLGEGVSVVPTPRLYASAGAACPPWCGQDLPGGPGETLHIGVERAVMCTAGGLAETGRTYVSMERLDRPGQPVGVANIRLEGAGGPMTAVEALQLAATLQVTAFAALLDTRAGVDDIISWAMALTDQAPELVAHQYGYTVERAAEVQAIVGTLVAAVEAEYRDGLVPACTEGAAGGDQ